MTTLHGALLDVHGVGILLLGPSGVGKSECALELVTRGHRLVADDVVELRCDDAGRVIGSAPAQVRHYMEIRGVGIIFVPDLFGADRVRDEMEVQLACQLERWQEGVEYERVGLERTPYELAGVQVPSLRLPARPGASMATIVDVAAREHQKRSAGVNAARQLDEKLRDAMRRS